MKRKRILVPTDLSPASLASVKYVARHEDPKTTEVILLYVLEPMLYPPTGYDYAAADLSAVLREQQRAARAQLDRLARKWRMRLPRLRAMMITGFAASSIIDAAKKLKVDSIAIATHGRTGLQHFFLGSVAERVVRTAPCAVLTVRSPGRAANQKDSNRKQATRTAKAA